MRFHPFRPTPSRTDARADCPFCSGLAANKGPLCNICRRAGATGGH